MKSRDKFQLEYSITEFKKADLSDDDMDMERAQKLLKQIGANEGAVQFVLHIYVEFCHWLLRWLIVCCFHWPVLRISWEQTDFGKSCTSTSVFVSLHEEECTSTVLLSERHG